MIEIKRTNDFFIRYLLGNIGSERLLLDFINAVITDSGREGFISVSILNPFNLKENKADKETVLDVKAKTKSGETVIVEVQSAGNESFIQRTLYYWAKNFGRKLQIGESYSDLKPVISINILDFKLIENEKAHSCYMLKELSNNDILTNHIELHFIELPKCDYKSLRPKLSSWAEFLGKENLEDIMEDLITKNPLMEEAIKKYEEFISNEDLVDEYDRRETFLIGQAMMIKREREKGLEEGIEKGIEKGKNKRNIEIAKNMKKKNMCIEDIIEITGLSKEEIEKL